MFAVMKDPSGVRRLNFARLIIGYTRRFAMTDVREALQYFFLLKVQMEEAGLGCSATSTYKYTHTHTDRRNHSSTAVKTEHTMND